MTDESTVSETNIAEPGARSVAVTREPFNAIHFKGVPLADLVRALSDEDDEPRD